MTKINMSGSNVGAKGICAVIDANGTVLPCLATDNGDGTATLKIDGEFTAAIDPGLLATESSLSSINEKSIEATISTGMKTLSGVSQNITIPSNTILCILTARGGPVYFNVGGDASQSTAYLPEESSQPIWLSGVTQLSVYGISGAYAHYTFHRGNI